MSSSSQSSSSHRRQAAKGDPLAVAVVTVSDTRTAENDLNGQYLRAEIERLGHELVAYHLVKDEPHQIQALLEELAAGEARVLLFNGGTGISKRDTTYDVLSQALEKTLPGFGELFRMLSWDQVGPAAMLSRATAGVYRGKLVFSTPGSPAAVQLAWQKLIAPDLEHLGWELTR